MRREFLENLGLEKESIDSIMAEHGKSVKAIQDKHSEDTEKLEKDLKDAQSTINKMQKANEDADKVQALADTYKEKFEKAEANAKEQKRSYEMAIALGNAGAKEKYLDTLKAQLKDVEIEDLPTKVDEIKKEFTELFESIDGNKPATQAPGYQVIPDPQGVGQPSSMTKDEILAIKDDNERQLAIARNIELFNN